MLSLDKVTRADFEAHLQKTFKLVVTDGAWPLQLVEVRSAGSAAPGAQREPFALTFRSATPIRLPQGTYRLENEDTGPMEIFLVQGSSTDIDAVFS